MEKTGTKKRPLWLEPPIYKDGGDSRAYNQYKEWVKKQGKSGYHVVKNREYDENVRNFNG